MSTYKYRIDIQVDPDFGINVTPTYPGYRVITGPNAGESFQGFGGSATCVELGPRGGQRYLFSGTAERLRSIAAALTLAAEQVEQRGVYGWESDPDSGVEILEESAVKA